MSTAGGRRIELNLKAVLAEYDRGDSLPVLGRRHGVHPETIRRRLKEAGVTLRPAGLAMSLSHNGRGDLIGLANDLGISEQAARELMLRHGFLYESPTKQGVPR